jgi:hypothetical protein
MRLLAEGEVVNELPMAPMWFGIVALVLFGVLLAATYAFKGAAHRHDPQAFTSHGHGSSAQGTGSH